MQLPDWGYNDPLVPDAAHEPALDFLPYLITGDASISKNWSSGRSGIYRRRILYIVSRFRQGICQLGSGAGGGLVFA